MTNQELEVLVRETVERVLGGLQVEDDRIELKSTWIEPKKAARRLAGHCNGARGADAIWIFGIDEKAAKIVGVNEVDFPDWWKQVLRHFENDAEPSLEKFVRFQTEHGQVVACLFATDRAPYVIIRGSNNSESDRDVDREVPVRVGTAVRSARRSDLLKILVPVSLSPHVEVLDHSVEVSDSGLGGLKSWAWHLEAELFIEPPPERRWTILVLRMAVRIRWAALPDGEFIEFDVVQFHGTGDVNASSTIDMATFDGPDTLKIAAWGHSASVPALSEANLVGVIDVGESKFSRAVRHIWTMSPMQSSAPPGWSVHVVR